MVNREVGMNQRNGISGGKGVLDRKKELKSLALSFTNQVERTSARAQII